MDKLEKVIKGLECCQIGCDRDCPYWTRQLGSTSICRSEMERDALALLKAQEPRLVTESDFNGADEYGYIPVWTEEKDGDMYWECIPKVAITDPDGIEVLRYWTARPTDEQRENTLERLKQEAVC